MGAKNNLRRCAGFNIVLKYRTLFCFESLSIQVLGEWETK